MVECITNPNCKIIDSCNKKVYATMAMEQAKGLTRYVCGIIPCEYSNQVSHPSHYNKDGRKECIVEMEERYGVEFTTVFCLMNSYKYLYRAGSKADNSYEQDRNKARWYFEYADKLIKKLEYAELLQSQNLLYRDIKGMLNNE